jgi:hypothetical protein
MLLHRAGEYRVVMPGGRTIELGDLQPPDPRAVNGPWTLTFPATSGIVRPMELDTLHTWSDLAQPQAQHFSGTACYHTRFSLPEVRTRILLDLGKVEVMARVRMNGKELGILWKSPYRVDVTDAVNEGINTLEIEVVNLWVNRLIGDAALPEDAQRDKSGRLLSWPEWAVAGHSSPAGRRSFVTFPLWKRDEPLKPSGLLGPVTLYFPVAVSFESGPAGVRRVAEAGRTPGTDRGIHSP